jgi:hypothetical protein
MLNYTKLDEKIDKYLGTNNLRPGPPQRLVNQVISNKNNNNNNSTTLFPLKEENKTKLNFNANSLGVTRNIKWSE